ncbi:DUF5134 domain-containing protein [Sciscionella marina]|uniref:DUF5134 domain-containing protein n=1 Tax=Sciscionella marina TaxID=508770 RepID=UPI0003775452|nr:DUF5134 domain-containing protein [Sciscionella marina]
MIESMLLRILLTILFAGTGLWCLHAAVRRFPRVRPSVADRVSWIAHVLMSAGMIAMAWPWGMSLPMNPQLALFALVALWFLGLAVRGHRPCVGHGNLRRLPHVHHAVMMGAMVWMIASMPMAMGGGGSSGGHHHMAMPGMPGMDMPATPSLPVVFVVANLVLGAYFLVTSLGWIASAVDHARVADTGLNRFAAGESTCHAAMSIGMGAMLLAML